MLRRFFFDFALNPNASFTMGDLFQGGEVEGVGDGPDNVKCIVEDCGYSSVWDVFRLQLKNVFGLPAFPLLNAAHGAAADTGPELYWDTVTAFVERYVSG